MRHSRLARDVAIMAGGLLVGAAMHRVLGDRHPAVTRIFAGVIVLMLVILSDLLVVVSPLQRRCWQRRDGALVAAPGLPNPVWAAAYAAFTIPAFGAWSEVLGGVGWPAVVIVVVAVGIVLSLRQTIELRPTGITIRALRRRDDDHLAWPDIAKSPLRFGRCNIWLAADDPLRRTYLSGRAMDVDPRVIGATIALYAADPARRAQIGTDAETERLQAWVTEHWDDLRRASRRRAAIPVPEPSS